MQHLKLCFIVLFALWFTSCGSDSEKSEPSAKSENQQNVEENVGQVASKMKDGEMSLAEGIGELQKALSGGETVEPVNFRTLKALLPESIIGLDRTSAEGEKSGGFGVKISTASGSYSNGDKELTLMLTDLGSVKGIAASAATAWMNFDIDRETETKIEQTFDYKGFKGFREYNNSSQSGEVNIVVAERFMAKIEGWNVTLEEIMTALDAVALDKLVALKDEGMTN